MNKSFTSIFLVFIALQIFNASSIEIAPPGAAIENVQDKGGVLKRADAATTTTEGPFQPSIPQRIRDAIFNGIRNFGNAVRFYPATLSELFRNVSRSTTLALTRNTTVVLIMENATSSSTTAKAPKVV